MQTGRAELCLSRGIPEAQRLYVLNASNEQSPIRIAPFAWRAAMISSEVARILIAEVLGYHAIVNPEPIYATIDGIRSFACSNCSSSDILMDTWLTPVSILWEEFQSENPGLAEDLGSMGYSGHDGLYVKGSIRDAANSQGLSLEYYKAYNLSFHQPYKYFDTLWEVPTDALWKCNDTFYGIQLDLMDSTTVKNYLDQTGDAEGVIEQNGQYRGNCQLPNWWISPACRHNYTQCIPVLQGPAAAPFVMQWSAAYGLPLALAHILVMDQYGNLLRNMNLLHYWWEPDETFIDLHHSRLILPPHSPAAWSKGDFRTASGDAYISKLAASHLRISAPRVRKFLQNFKLDSSQLLDLLRLIGFGEDVAHDEDGSRTIREAACQWVRTKDDVWDKWVPVATDCTGGFGLANAQGAPVASLDEAVDCRVCPAGRFSELFTPSSGPTYRCQLCDPGYHQSLFGQSSCVQCDAGTYAAEAGQAICSPCGRGSFVNFSAAKECFTCGPKDVWTTSRLEFSSEEKWIEVEGAMSASDCHCVEGRYLSSAGQCEVCIEGASCPGSGVLTLLPGFYSTHSDPGSILRCFGNSLRCPGGTPETCAEGRDPRSVACSSCLPGLQPSAEECVPCTGGDYVSLAAFAMLVLVATAALHVVLALLDRSATSYRGALLGAALCLNQLITCAQLFNVMEQIQGIIWAEPFLSFLQFFAVLSLRPLLDSVRTISCVTRISDEVAFFLRTLLVPLFFAVGPLLAHITMSAAKLSPKVINLVKTLGFLFLLFYISLCSSFVEPFRCNVHPNGSLTMQTAHSVFCDYSGTHLNLCWMCIVFCLIPIGFLVMCIWFLLVVLPRRVNAANASYVRACSFLIMRFKPGYEIFTVAFLFRNVLFVLAPTMQSSTSLFVMGNLLALTAVSVAYFKPWRSDLASHLDLLVSSVLLTVLILGALTVKDAEPNGPMILCTVCGSLVIFALITGTFYYVVYSIASKLRKKYKFFLSHHRTASAGYARLLRMDLKKLGFDAFIDSDNLTDLSRLFDYISNDTQTFVLLASPQVLTRKWCMGELVVARLAQVDAVLLTFPDFEAPDKAFVQNYASIVPEVKELAVFGLGLVEVQDTLRWLCGIARSGVCSFQIPNEFSTDNFSTVIGQLTGKVTKNVDQQSGNVTDYLILADPGNVEAMATAHVLGRLLVSIAPERGWSPRVLAKDGNVWLMQARVMQHCQILPVITDEKFHVPRRHGGSVSPGDGAHGVDETSYIHVIKAIFVEVALPFVPSQSSEVDLGIRSRQLIRRLYGDLKPLSTKLLLVGGAPEVPEAEPQTDDSIADSSNASLHRLNLQVQDGCRHRDIEAELASETVSTAF
eukprot:Skav201616  [mRNA]  locus=scaffold152:1234360:1241265:+ [translate_table: standard]